MAAHDRRSASDHRLAVEPHLRARQRLRQDPPRLPARRDHRRRSVRRVPAVRWCRLRRGLRDRPSRAPELAALVASLPPIMAGIYGNPFPAGIETLGGSIAWKTGALARPHGRPVVDPRAVGRPSRPRRAAAVSSSSPSTPIGLRRIAIEKLFAHLTGMAIVVIVIALSAWARRRSAFATLPGDEIPSMPRSGTPCGSASWRSPPGPSRSRWRRFVGRGAAAGIAGAVLLGGYVVNGYQTAVPAFAGIANVTWFGWTAHHQPLGWPARLGVAHPGRHRGRRPVRGRDRSVLAT